MPSRRSSGVPVAFRLGEGRRLGERVNGREDMVGCNSRLVGRMDGWMFEDSIATVDAINGVT